MRNKNLHCEKQPTFRLNFVRIFVEYLCGQGQLLIPIFRCSTRILNRVIDSDKEVCLNSSEGIQLITYIHVFCRVFATVMFQCIVEVVYVCFLPNHHFKCKARCGGSAQKQTAQFFTLFSITMFSSAACCMAAKRHKGPYVM